MDPGDRPNRAAWLDPFRYRNFRLLVAARTVDYLGNGVAPIALAFAVLDLTGSVTDLGVVVGTRSIVNVALLLFGGVIADRFPRPVVLQGSALLAAASETVMAASVLGRFDSVWLLAILGAVDGAAAAVALPATSALTPQTVPPTLFRPANALTRVGISIAKITGASVGGVLVAAVGPGWGLAVDAASFLCVALCFAGLRIPRSQHGGAQTLLRDLRDGWRAFTRLRWVWVVTLQFLICNAMITGATQVLGPAIADRTIGRTAWGVVVAAQTLGALAGGVLAVRWQPRHALAVGVGLILFEVPPILALGYAPNTVVLVIAMFVSGVATEQFSVAWEVSVQQNIPADRLASVYSYDALGSFLGLPLGQFTIGPLAGAWGTAPTLVGTALLLVFATAASLAVPSVRRLTNTAQAPVPSSAPPE
jgi:MFS family permease